MSLAARRAWVNGPGRRARSAGSAAPEVPPLALTALEAARPLANRRRLASAPLAELGALALPTAPPPPCPLSSGGRGCSREAPAAGARVEDPGAVAPDAVAPGLLLLLVLMLPFALIAPRFALLVLVPTVVLAIPFSERRGSGPAIRSHVRVRRARASREASGTSSRPCQRRPGRERLNSRNSGGVFPCGFRMRRDFGLGATVKRDRSVDGPSRDDQRSFHTR
jgi:hypothetical protein